MGNDVLEVGKYGAKVNLKETERGHYALPLFTGFRGCTDKKLVIEDKHDKTQDVSAAEFSQCSKRIRCLGTEREGCSHELRRPDEPGHANGVVHEDAVDQRAAERGVGRGCAGRAERPECQDSGRGSRSQRRRARRRRTRDLRAAGQYHLQRGQVPESRSAGELQDCVYDRQEVHFVGEKVHQWEVRSEHRKDDPPNDDSVSALRGSSRSTQVNEAQGDERCWSGDGSSKPSASSANTAEGKGSAKVSFKGIFEQSERGCDNSGSCTEACLARDGSRGPVAAHAGHRAIPSREQFGAPSALDSGADRELDSSIGGSRRERGSLSQEFSEAEEKVSAVMTRAEKKLCRRGMESCSPDGSVVEATGCGLDVLVLQAGSGENVLTAVGLSTKVEFQELAPQDVRKPGIVDEMLQKLRDLDSRVLVVRPPDHMTKTRGSKCLVRTYHARQRAAFTKLVSACCAEQMCEGRLFCIEDVNDCMSDRVSQWIKQKDDERVLCVERHESESSWRLSTNCQKIAEESRKTWINQRELQDTRCFMTDVATGVLRMKQEIAEVHVAHCVYSIETRRSQDPQDDRRIMTVLRRCHENLGHPSPAGLQMLLRAAHASERVMKLAKGLERETCAEVSRPKSHHVTKLRRATEFNQQLCVDTFEQEVRDQRVHFLNIVDEATGFQMCVPLWKGMQAKFVRNAYRKNWKRWAGAPIRLFSDGGKEFAGEFEHGLTLDGTYGDTSAAYSPWQNGLVEKRGDIWKTAYAKAQVEVRPRNKQEVQELIGQVNNAVNSMTRKDRYSPNQHVFGRDVRVPGMLCSDHDPDQFVTCTRRVSV